MCEESGEPLPLQTLRWERGEVSCADASGALLAAGGGDGALRLWRWRRGAGWLAAGGEPRAHRFGVTAARWADSGALLASAGVDGVARVWTRDLRARRVLAAPGAAAARSLCWAAASVLVGHDDGALCVWAVRAGTLLARVQPCEGALHALAAHARHALVLAACTSGTLKIFDLNEVRACGAPGREPAAPLLWQDGAHDLGALCAAVSREGDALATGGHDARIRLWHVGGARGARGARVNAGEALSGHAAAVTALSWAAAEDEGGDGAGSALLASASLDRTARLWAPRARACLRVLHAHTRYLTCVVLARDARFLITGSNDRTLRAWPLRALALHDDLEPACSPLAHFGLGDLEGIEPIYDDGPYEDTLVSAGSGEPVRAWDCEEAHEGAINAIAACGQLLVTACSDGALRVFRWCEEGGGRAVLQRVVRAHGYPAMAADLGADGALLLSAGLDGRARLWDTKSGCELAAVSGEGVGGEPGGGGVRGARLSPHRPPLLLLATDDGAVAVWGLDTPATEPLHVYEPFAEAATCCAWAPDGRVCAAGGAACELRVLAAPPAARALCSLPAAHDLGVLSCDFAKKESADDPMYTLASAGRDACVKVWAVRLESDAGAAPRAAPRLLWRVEAHGGAVECVRWGAAASSWLVSCGVDGWARAWRPTPRGERPEECVAVPAPGASAACPLGAALLAVGTLTGELTVWRLPRGAAADAADEGAAATPEDEGEGEEPRQWGAAGVARWLREYVTDVPGSAAAGAAALALRARVLRLSGAQLLDEPLEELLRSLLPPGGEHGADEKEEKGGDDAEELLANSEEAAAESSPVHSEETQRLRTRLREELLWLRRELPGAHLAARAPHRLRCPLTHALLREPARAADGFSYERANVLDHFFAAGGAVSPLTGRRLRSARVRPNLRLRDELRAFLDAPRDRPLGPSVPFEPSL